MTRTSANENGAARVAVLGAPTAEGAHLRKALAARGVPGGRVDLYGTTGGEVVLSEYAGEARMIQEPDLDELASHDLIFICERGEMAGRLVQAASSSVIIDLQDCLPDTARPRTVRLHMGPEVARGEGRFAVPHPLALVLAEALSPLDERYELREAMAVVIRPAADFGSEGVEELREQTVRLLNFAQLPTQTFGRQLAFNILPDASRQGLDGRIEREVGELLGWTERRFTLKLLTAPLFYGHGIQLRFRLEKEAGPAEVRTTLEEAGLLSAPASEAPPTPLDVAGEVLSRFTEPSADGLGGYWLWGVAGETGSRGAQHAVRLAAALFDL